MDKEPLYTLLKDFTDPNGTVKKGVIKTANQWCARFALLNHSDCDIKTDWFRKVDNEPLFLFANEDMRRCFEQARLINPMAGFKHDTFEDFMANETLEANRQSK